MTQPLLKVENLMVEFHAQGRSGGSAVRAVDGVSFEVGQGETLAIVGESGCGKSTLARTLVGLQRPTAGTVSFPSAPLTAKRGRAVAKAASQVVQFVFQDPYTSLAPRMNVGSIVAEPLHIHGIGSSQSRETRAGDLLDLVGLPSTALQRYPHELSGGQRQRVGIARALALNPELIVLDEPVSALDVSIQAQIINLLIRLREELNFAYVFIAHDLAVVRHIAGRVCVMSAGQFVEVGGVDQVFGQPKHPFTKRLLESVPIDDPRKRKPIQARISSSNQRILSHETEHQSQTAPAVGKGNHE